METHLNDTPKFEKINLKNDGILSFAFNQEKHVDNILKKLVASSIRSEETKRSLISVGNRPSVGFVKITKISIIAHLFDLLCQQLTLLPIN